MRVGVRVRRGGGMAAGDTPTLEARGDGAEPRIACGTWVKVRWRSERGVEQFWCRVTALRADGALVGRIENDLVHSCHRCGDVIELRACHVLETAEEADLSVYLRMAAALGPAGGVLAWRELRKQAGVAVEAMPNTHVVV